MKGILNLERWWKDTDGIKQRTERKTSPINTLFKTNLNWGLPGWNPFLPRRGVKGKAVTLQGWTVPEGS